MRQTSIQIIIADSDQAQARAFVDCLSKQEFHYAVSSTDKVADVRDKLRTSGLELVIAEHILADGTVFDILKVSPQPAIIVLTGSGSEQLAVETLQAGAADYIIKTPDNRHLELLPAAVEKAMEAKARQSQFKTLTHAIMSIHDSVFITNMEDTVIFVNRAFCATYGFAEQEILGRHVSVFWQDCPLSPLPSQDASLPADVLNLRSDGREFPVSLSRSVVHDDNGQAFAVVGVARDITDRMQAEQQLKASLSEKEVLLREIHHRVKNNLQIISSMLNLQSGYIHDTQTNEALRGSQNRVKSMALIHERLYQSETLTKVDFTAYVQTLVEHVRSSFRDTERLHIAVFGSPLLVDVDVAVPCGLIVNELLTNAIKHAFPGTREGRIDIRLELSQAAAELPQEMLLQVQDNGVGLPPDLEPDKIQTLGLQLVTMLAQQLKGTVHFEGQQGASCKVVLPLP